ncbi:MAG: methyltransferase domain-containing protein, partial [Cyanobacteriota bacterium]|nr:methyltransferase domain-containing protein [Cyanobacteriota bacterium]
MKEKLYDKEFYENQQQGSIRSARVVVGKIMNLIQPKSVVDIGCGVGTWLSVFEECGVSDYLGVDGEYVEKQMLKIPEAKFKAFDLKRSIALNREFDLVVSLEVAEHLPPENAETFIKTLTNLGPVVMFSAAIPYQGGVGHFNEQWPEYWQEHFRKYGYVVFDAIRAKIWNDEAVEPWYRQNIFLYVKENCIDNYPQLKKETEGQQSLPLALVHP